MKLLNKYSRVHVITACIVLLISSVSYYFIIQNILLKQIDKDLKVEEQEILDYIHANNSLPQASDYRHQQIRFVKSGENIQDREITNTMEFDEREKEYEPFRRLSFPVTANNQHYTASVYKSRVETEDLLRLIMIVTALIFIILSAVMFIINRFVLGKLWQPFFNTLSELRTFNLQNKKRLNLTKSTIDEFEELNSSVSQMTDKISNEYETLKAFTDNASHEIQTPIAIIQSKLDLLIQDEAITEKQSKILQAVYDAIQRLNRLNTSLLLLAKIENKQYAAFHKINLKKKTEEKIADFNELWQANKFEVSCTLKDSIILMNYELADILINNLLSNATKHNYNGGKILISLTEYHLMITNTSNEPLLNEEKIFQRFYKPSQSKENNGLGLSIIKQICDASDMIATYYFNEEKHNFKIQWNSNR